MPRTPESTKLDSEQIDKIQKLIRLANNNPNEHEANLAARRACKMLDGYLFPLTSTISPKSPIPPTNPSTNPYQEAWYKEPEKPKSPVDDFINNYYRQRGSSPFSESWWGFGGFNNKTTGRSQPGSNREAKQGPTENTSQPHADQYYSTGRHTDPYGDFKKAYTQSKDAYGSTPPQSEADYIHIDDFDGISDRLDQIYDEIAFNKQMPKGAKKRELDIFLKHQSWERSINKRTIPCRKCARKYQTGYSEDVNFFICLQCELNG